jgi:hypothetical protein
LHEDMICGQSAPLKFVPERTRRQPDPHKITL